MSRPPRASSTGDGTKTAYWSIQDRRPMISEIVIDGHASTERLPLDLADAREAMPRHTDLWNVVQHEFWTKAIFDSREFHKVGAP
jgi:hypothetical protein